MPLVILQLLTDLDQCPKALGVGGRQLLRPLQTREYTWDLWLLQRWKFESKSSELWHA